MKTTNKYLIGIGAVAVLYLGYKAKKGAEAAAAAINPVNPENIANQAFESVFGSVGSWVYENLTPSGRQETELLESLNKPQVTNKLYQQRDRVMVHNKR